MMSYFQMRLRVLGLVFLLGMSFSHLHPLRAQTQDYLTDDEIEKLREAQEPPERIEVLVELLERRFDGARTVKDPAFVRKKVEEPASTEKKGTSPNRKKTEVPAEVQAPRSFIEWMNEYLQCLEEVSSNVENFADVPKDYKAYLKSLHKLDESIAEELHWINQIRGSLDRSELKLIEEVGEVSEELAEDVKAAIEKTEEQNKLFKEAQKAKSRK